MWRGTGGELGEKGAGGVQEAGEEGQDAGFPRWWEAGEKGEKMQHCAIFCNRKNAKRRKPKKYRAGTEIKGYGKWEV